MVKVKICGITNLKDAEAAIAAGADALGFVFAKSPRNIKPKDAAKIIDKLPPFVNTVAVFADTPAATVEKTVRQCRIDTLQFHGNESPAYCRYFMKAHKVIKAFRIKGKNSLKAIKKYKVDGYLLDAFIEGVKGGTGKTFDLKFAKYAKKSVSPVILSGGLNPENVAGALNSVMPYAVDVSSGVEKIPGKKDHKLIRKFMKAVKK